MPAKSSDLLKLTWNWSQNGPKGFPSCRKRMVEGSLSWRERVWGWGQGTVGKGRRGGMTQAEHPHRVAPLARSWGDCSASVMISSRLFTRKSLSNDMVCPTDLAALVLQGEADLRLQTCGRASRDSQVLANTTLSFSRCKWRLTESKKHAQRHTAGKGSVGATS
jgi:hypothetical protein